MASKALTDCPENLREAIDWLIQVKHGDGIQKLSDALGKLFDNVVQDAEESLSSLPESDEPSARDVIDKLQTFQNAVTKNSENLNQNTLHNLCSTVEKFLGYHPTGTYDGSGIVYSSASRVCDAVMSFLYALFSDVYENQPYVVGRVLLGGLVSDLEKARWSGHHGFSTVVPKVATGLEDYNRKVKDSNDRVKRPIDELLEYVNPGGELYRGIHALQVDNVTEKEVKKAAGLVEECQKRADGFYNNMNTVASTTSAIKDLNPTLRDKVMSAKKHTTQERKRLQNLTRKERDNLEAMTKMIRKALTELENNVSIKIGEQIDALVEKLKGMVEKIRAKLVDIYLALGKYVDELEAWITEAKKFIGFAERNVKIILDEVTVKKSGEKPEKWKKIDDLANDINKKLGEENSKLQTWINSAEETRGKAEKRAREAFDILSYYKNDKSREKTELAENLEAIEHARNKIAEVNKKLQDADIDLGQWQNAADKVLQGVVSNSKNVKEKLNPEKNSGHEIGQKIGAIIDAKDKLDHAKNTLAQHLGSLASWKGEAYTVIGEAVSKAQAVHDALQEDKQPGSGKTDLGQQIQNIDNAKQDIQNANNTLATKLTALQNWHKAASEIVTKAETKCTEILRRVDKDSNSGAEVKIKEQAQKLKEKANDLLSAYQQTFTTVSDLGQKVTAAVEDLEKGMKVDLQRLQKDIVSQMKKHVGGMLSSIRDSVGQIKGEAGKGDQNTGGAGLEGIVAGVQQYAKAFAANWSFRNIVGGWAEGILGSNENHNKKEPKKWLQRYVDDNNGRGGEAVRLLNGDHRGFSWSKKIIEQIETKFEGAIKKAAGVVEKDNDNIQKIITSVKSGCELFVNGLDEELNKGIGTFSNKIFDGIANGVTGGHKEKNTIQPAIQAALIGLSATASQVGKELHSVFLGEYRMGNNGKCIARELDKVVQDTRNLDTKLDNASKTALGTTALSVPPGPDNKILQKVIGIEEEVNKGMQRNGGKLEVENNFKTIMSAYEVKKNNPAGQQGLYKKLTTKDIPNAMDAFKSVEGLESGGTDGVEPTKKALTSAFEAIEQELQAISWFVDNGKLWPPSLKDQPQDQDGIRQRLGDLSEMLRKEDDVQLRGKGLNMDTVKGLKAIEDKIKQLKESEYDKRTKEIGEALPTIRDELRKLRDTLMKSDKNDVIYRLYDFQYIGLEHNSWSPNGLRVDGLGKIHTDIAQLQKNQFTQNPRLIGGAVLIITQSLNNLQSDLDKNVTAKLESLKSNGLNHTENWDGQYKNVKGFETIKETIKELNEELGKQPDAIENVVENIRVELAKIGIKLHNVALDGDVVDHLRALRTLISKHDNRQGLQAIHKALDGVHTLVPVINAKLTELCEAVKMPGMRVEDALERLSTLINHDYVVISGGEQHGLNEIKNQIKRLRADLLSGPIDACEQFLRDTDAAGRLTKQRLREHLREQINIAEDAMIAQANSNYVSSVKQMLQQYASKVNSELGKLPAEIDHDLAVGVKGLMKQIAGDNNGNINLLTDVSSIRDLSYRFNVFCGRLRLYLEAEIKREHLEQMSQRNPVPRGPETLYTDKLDEIYTALNDLLGHLTRQKRYDHEMLGKLDKLADAVNALRPQGFTKPNSPLLDGIGEGLRAFVGELRHVYISTYDGAFDDCVLFHAAKKTHTPEATKCAMILLTITDIIFRGINRLRMGCADGWAHHNINAYNPLGQFLGRCGFVVASEGVIHAELRNENACNDAEICSLIHDALEPLDAFHDMLKYYLRVCHLRIPPEPRYPCTVRDILAWLAGLPHTAVYNGVQAHCHNLLRDRNNSGDAVLSPILSTGLHFSLVDTSVLAYDLLVTVCGNGRGFDHADYKYACNFWDNSRGFHYPSDVDELLDILARLCKRALRALNFLRARCRYDASMGHGWSQCRYGRNVPAANWQCGDHSSDKAVCQPKSPLQAHLMDGLVCLLPHKLTSVGCDSECSTCPTASPGQQCVTPMGFWDLPRAASRTGVGRDIFAVLTALCSNAESPLPTLLRCLLSINPCPPQSLGDMFAFFCNLAQCRQSGKYVDNSGFTANLNANVIPSVSMNLCPTTQAVRLTSALTALYHSPADHATAAQADADTDKNTNTDTHSDLSSLTVRAHCSDSLTCAPYLQPLSFHACHTFPERHAHLYLSWVVHLAWHFWGLLRELLDQFQNIDCRASGCVECPCNPGQHGVEFNCKCGALVSCGGVMPTLFHHGFTFGNAGTLYQTNRKYCRHFHTQLQNVLHSNHFTELFRQIDQLLWHIREPFLYTIVSLWSIATVFLAYTMLYRIDVLRIRSHLLTSKASHLIDVKALLTHGREMLSLYHDVDYFDDEPFD
ncbi:Extracellular matrix-binding ebh, putative [Babesia ovata]|uniref:Extracellular matrix-binding ebh, putative n=1 Tax=Babesia ovata TaxID=189622 RepID=A0A2H6K972_9APIC|nr:Extracellular matrix-binding ebh, putative [Babesia ovata]GBE59528.1 Extracellular matrix-binding ebh, putative [Babesia ovata]